MAKAEALKAWAKIEDADAKLGDILAGLERSKRSQQWTKDGGQQVASRARKKAVAQRYEY